MVALFNKVVRLSMKSMTETNSGKLISLISADLFAIEKGVSLFPLLFAAPFINLIACYLMAITVGFKMSLIVWGMWILLMAAQVFVTSQHRRLKGEESGINDERLKLVNDLVVGCRTIKCYGWENYYIERIKEIR